MSVENERFIILSRSGEFPEKVPAVGETFPLKIQEKEGQVTSANIALILADYVANLGPYAHVIGRVNMNTQDEIRCEAKYDTVNVFPENTNIGNLTLKKVTNEL